MELFTEANDLLANSNRPSIQTRLTNAENLCKTSGQSSKWEDFSLPEQVLIFEAKFIKDALEETGGRVTKASKLLGLSHQNLSLLLKTRHSALASAKKSRKKRSDRKRKPRSKK